MDIPTDRNTDSFILDSLHYTTSLGPKLVILMFNPQILGGIRESGNSGLLGNNYPNPFSASTTISFRLPIRGSADLGIYDLNGKLVRLVFSGSLDEGDHAFTWDGTDNTGNKATPGIYLFRLTTDKEVSVKRMILIR